MKSVLASLKPYYYYLVGEGIKKIEVRKSQPKADDWNKETYFYMSKDEKSFAMIPKEFQEKYRKHFGKVGLKFVCDRIGEFFSPQSPLVITDTEDLFKKACLKREDTIKYIGEGKMGYAWHISNLVIYDEPKELFEFYPTKHKPMSEWTDNDFCQQCKYHQWIGSMKSFVERGIQIQEKCTLKKPEPICEYTPPLTRPPQSWCYVEEKE